ncbi:acyl carrier protein [Pararhizobium mangrovi]|uniref:Acyl carrier protein n=1 Tax=Pararhizobium mangrovi TaxID=2590452 RepID=A0A506UA54_9HYPH|nr:acyl carrier protein [Pararhizobium mangrovi]TPW29944.1 acyl carrier protein [Pararhizobium mangrovi]
MEDVSRDISGEIISVLESVIDKPLDATSEKDLVSDLGMDSIALMNFSMALEDHFDVSIPLDRMAEVETLGDLSDTIENLLRKGK